MKKTFITALVAIAATASIGYSEASIRGAGQLSSQLAAERSGPSQAGGALATNSARTGQLSSYLSQEKAGTPSNTVRAPKGSLVRVGQLSAAIKRSAS